MPVEIRELVIRANVEDRREQTAAQTETNADRSEFNRLMTQMREMKMMLKEKNER